MFSRELVNEFSWSKSRHAKFEECRRLYWYHYYRAWGGWSEEAGAEAREAYVLKNLSSRQQWAGHVVHELIAFALAMTRAGEAPPVETLVARAHARMREDFARSRRGEYRQRPKRVVGLVEHELRAPVPDAEWRANWSVAETSLRRFHASQWLERARALPRDAWLPIDEIGSFELDRVKVFAGPDFAYRDGSKLMLVDWKTGRPRPEDRQQVQGYALFAQARWGARPEEVVARLVYLASGEEIDVGVSAGDLEAFQRLFRRSVLAMRDLLDDPAQNLARRESFPMTEERARCGLCPFQGLCERREEIPSPRHPPLREAQERG